MGDSKKRNNVLLAAVAITMAMLPIAAFAANAQGNSQLLAAEGEGRRANRMSHGDNPNSAAQLSPGHMKKLDSYKWMDRWTNRSGHGEDGEGGECGGPAHANFTGNWSATQTVSGTAHEFDHGELELMTTSGSGTRMIAEVVLPRWYVAKLGIEAGDSVSATGAYPLGIENEEDFGLVPFQITFNGTVYGNATSTTPVWLQ